MIEVTFEDTPEEVLSGLTREGKVDAQALLAALEGYSEEAVEEAFLALRQDGVAIDLETLPHIPVGEEMEKRLQVEENIAKSGILLGELEENDPLRLYLEELARIPAAGDPNVLAMELLQGNEAAAQRLTDQLLYLTVEEARALAGRGVLLLDLIQEGSLGLLQCVNSYTGGDIETQCRWWVRQYMAAALVQQARSAGVGQHLRRSMDDYRDVDQRLLGELGRNPTLEEIAEGMHIAPEEAQRIGDMVRAARMLHQAKDLPEQTQEQAIEDTQAVEDTAYFQMRQRISELLSKVSPEDARLLTLRFGLEGGMPLEPAQVGTLLGLSATQVLQREAAALAKLRENI